MKCCTSTKLQKAKDKFTKKRDQICGPQRRGEGRGRGKGNWMKAVGRYKLQSRHKKSSGCSAQHEKRKHHCRTLHTKLESKPEEVSSQEKSFFRLIFFFVFHSPSPINFINKEPQLEPKSEQVAVSLTLHELTNVCCAPYDDCFMRK